MRSLPFLSSKIAYLLPMIVFGIKMLFPYNVPGNMLYLYYYVWFITWNAVAVSVAWMTIATLYRGGIYLLFEKMSPHSRDFGFV